MNTDGITLGKEELLAAAPSNFGKRGLEMTDTRLTIREAVAEKLGNLSDRTRLQVVEHFAAIEATKQANALIAGLDKLAGLEKDRQRIKPGYSGFDIDGKGIGDQVYSKDQVDQIKKIGEQIEKLTKAINKADNDSDFGDLYNLVK
jgi:hypothetical protein